MNKTMRPSLIPSDIKAGIWVISKRVDSNIHHGSPIVFQCTGEPFGNEYDQRFFKARSFHPKPNKGKDDIRLRVGSLDTPDALVLPLSDFVLATEEELAAAVAKRISR